MEQELISSISSEARVAAGERLRSLFFTDLFFSEAGQTMLRGVPDSEGALSPVPYEAHEDVALLHRLVCERGSREPEFALDFYGLRFRVARTETEGGVWYTLRRGFSRVPRLGALAGIPAATLRHLIGLGADGQNGLILICGGTGHGKTTTASALLVEYLIQYGNIAVTIEDPAELPLNGQHGAFGHCFQTEVTGDDFALAMRRTLRRSPRYIMLGEVRGPQEASEVVRASNNGHLVISTIHAGSVTEGVNSLLKLIAGVQPVDLARSMLSDGLTAVVHQKLEKVRDSEGLASMRLEIQTLFLGRGSHNQASRSLIRQGKLEQLSTEIKRQEGLIRQGKDPLL